MSENFAELYAQSLASKKKKLHYGMQVSGKIIGISDTVVFVDVGAKIDGYVEKSELLDVNGNFNYKIGDTVQLYVVTNTESELKLSKALSGEGGYGVLKDAFERQILVSGKVKDQIKGGFEVIVMGKRAFCPISHMDIKKIENPQEYVGNTYNFKIITFDEVTKNIILSRRPVIEQEQKEELKLLVSSLKSKDIVSGKVLRVSESGAVISLGNYLEGFIPKSELSWQRIKHASEVVNPGDIITAKIFKIDDSNETQPKILLSLKQLSLHPWEEVTSKLKKNDIVKGKITRITNFGAFVEIAPNVEGLVHISEISNDKNVKKINDLLKIGDTIEVLILDINYEKRQIALSIKALQNNIQDSSTTSTKNDEEDWRNFMTIDDDIDDENPFKVIKEKFKK